MALHASNCKANRYHIHVWLGIAAGMLPYGYGGDGKDSLSLVPGWMKKFCWEMFPFLPSSKTPAKGRSPWPQILSRGSKATLKPKRSSSSNRLFSCGCRGEGETIWFQSVTNQMKNTSSLPPSKSICKRKASFFSFFNVNIWNICVSCSEPLKWSEISIKQVHLSLFL